ncbi:hypothetical protein C8R43DRAFT_890873 [Mycena crocata]|nr:hypothetical protein C8R43DRAFT_890873 [Mycena crocata]
MLPPAAASSSLPLIAYNTFDEDEPIRETMVHLTNKMTLSVLYRHPPHTILEYPETAASPNSIGHLFPMDPDNWEPPEYNIAYSRGAPMGGSLKDVFVDVMVDGAGNTVPCRETHSTCCGVKVCPFSDTLSLSQPHTHASRANIQTRLRQDRDERLQHASPTKDIFSKTSAYLAAIRKLGCSHPPDTQLANNDVPQQDDIMEYYWKQRSRGYRPKDSTCEGKIRIIFFDDFTGSAAGSYDLNYIQAVLNEDEEEAKIIEEAAFSLGYGPLVPCTTITNNSSQRAICPYDHRDSNGLLSQPLMERMKCEVKFRVYEPVDEYRRVCPYILIVSSGIHTHPIPLPTKTPPSVRTTVMQLLEKLGDDLPDITPRRFLRHPVVRAFLAEKFPRIPSPTLSHLHVSLANRSHIKSYIKEIRKIYCPHGTGWAAVQHLKELQDAHLPKSEHYIRRMIIFNANTMEYHEEDEDDKSNDSTYVRIIICMSREASHRLLERGCYLQSDIAFKRIVDFLEFEMACMDRDANTSVTFCRVFLNRQTAVAHRCVFEAIHSVVLEDTGQHLKWRHLDGSHLEDYKDLILQWGADQHRGQAKGLGLYLQRRAASMPPKADLHEPWRLIQDLTPYEHLHRVYRICSNHYLRKVTESSVSREVKRLMRSLLCVEHLDWTGTLTAIQDKGGKTGQDWLKDKLNSHFVLEAICWEKSFIPLAVWKAGDPTSNLVEAVHRDVNLEGKDCTLLGGLQKGHTYDAWKMRTLEMYETYGIRPTHLAGHISENAFANLRRRDNAQRRLLLAQDSKISNLNDKLRKSFDALCKARQAIVTKISTNLAHHDIREALQRLTKYADGHLENYLKLVEEGKTLQNSGSGKMRIIDFDVDPNATT